MSWTETGADPGLDWNFLQCFGERTPGEEVQEGVLAADVCFAAGVLSCCVGKSCTDKALLTTYVMNAP